MKAPFAVSSFSVRQAFSRSDDRESPKANKGTSWLLPSLCSQSLSIPTVSSYDAERGVEETRVTAGGRLGRLSDRCEAELVAHKKTSGANVHNFIKERSITNESLKSTALD